MAPARPVTPFLRMSRVERGICGDSGTGGPNPFPAASERFLAHLSPVCFSGDPVGRSRYRAKAMRRRYLGLSENRPTRARTMKTATARRRASAQMRETLRMRISSSPTASELPSERPSVRRGRAVASPTSTETFQNSAPKSPLATGIVAVGVRRARSRGEVPA